MKVNEYLEEINDIKGAVREIDNVLNHVLVGEGFTYSTQALQEAKEVYEEQLNSMLNSNLKPSASVIKLIVDTSLSLAVGDEVDLSVKALMSNGELTDVTAPTISHVTFKDFDGMFNNSGLLTSVNAEGFIYDTPTQYNIIKTVGGWSVSNSNGEQGLQIVETEENSYKITDFQGEDQGVSFTTDGNSSVGDDWVLEVVPTSTGTEYITEHFDVISINDYGHVVAVGSGYDVITVSNAGQEVNVVVTVEGNGEEEVPGEVELDELPVYESSFRVSEKEGEEDARYFSIRLGLTEPTKIGDLTSLTVSLYNDDELLVTNTLNSEGFSDHADITVIDTSFILGTEGNTEYAWDRGAYAGEQPNKVVIEFGLDGVLYRYTTDDIPQIEDTVEE